jgi:hypothetical protein
VRCLGEVASNMCVRHTLHAYCQRNCQQHSWVVSVDAALVCLAAGMRRGYAAALVAG